MERKVPQKSRTLDLTVRAAFCPPPTIIDCELGGYIIRLGGEEFGPFPSRIFARAVLERAS